MTDAYERNLAAADLAVGDTGPRVVVEDLEREDFVRYAGASGDFNPIHYDEPLAEAAGYDSVFAQGMLTAGVAAHAVSDFFGLGNVRSFDVRFQSQVWPGDTVTAIPEVTAVESEGDTATVEAEGDTATVEAEVRVTNQDDEVVVSGEATAEVPAE